MADAPDPQKVADDEFEKVVRSRHVARFLQPDDECEVCCLIRQLDRVRAEVARLTSPFWDDAYLESVSRR